LIGQRLKEGEFIQADGYEVYTALGLNTAEDQIHTLLPENWKPPTA
jgi:hypothetical protein